jgi:hypothetical protein
MVGAAFVCGSHGISSCRAHGRGDAKLPAALADIRCLSPLPVASFRADELSETRVPMTE